MKTNSKSGFTIIEAILILAVVGLIVLVVFIALPALQQSQNETTRRNDISELYKSLVQYQTDNSANKDNLPQKGSYVAPEDGSTSEEDCDANSACKFIRDYINVSGNNFVDPDGTPYSLVVTSNYAEGALKWDALQDGDEDIFAQANSGFTLQADAFSRHMIFVVPGGRCSDGVVRKANRRRFAIITLVEKESIYCLDDQQE